MTAAPSNKNVRWMPARRSNRTRRRRNGCNQFKVRSTTHGGSQGHCHGALPLGQHRQDVQAALCLAQRIRVVGSVARNLSWPLLRPAPFPFHRRDSFKQGHRLSHILHVGSRQSNGHGHTLGIGNYMVLAASLGPVRGIEPGEVPPKPPSPKRCLPLPGSNPAGWQPATAPGSAV